jgi:hypothetical protein
VQKSKQLIISMFRSVPGVPHEKWNARSITCVLPQGSPGFGPLTGKKMTCMVCID